MSEGWQIGDLAECLDNRPCPFEQRAHRLEVGRIYRVAKLGVPKGSPTGVLCLAFLETTTPDDRNMADAFQHTRFRRVQPPRIEPCEQEFTALLKRSKRPVKA